MTSSEKCSKPKVKAPFNTLLLLLYNLKHINNTQLMMDEPEKMMKKKENSFMRRWSTRIIEREKKTTTENDMAKRWRELSGEKNWEGLLDHLDIDLRRYIIHYGELAQATYDTFNSQSKSKFAGSSIYARRNLFAGVSLKDTPSKYVVTKYFYATSKISVPEAFIVVPLSRESWNKESNWMGYVAVATDEGKVALGRREIVVAWRGTVMALEWINDLSFTLVSGKEIFGEGSSAKIHQGWLSIYTSDDHRSPYNKTSAREQVTSFLLLLHLYKYEI